MPNSSHRTGLRFAFAGTLLRAAAVVAGLAALLAAAGAFLGGRFAPLEIPAVWAFAAATAVGLLLGLAACIDQQRDLLAWAQREEEYRRQQPPDLGPQLAAGAGLDDTTRTGHPDESAWARGAAAVDPAASQELVALMRDMRDNLLLDDAQRREKLKRLADDEMARVQAALTRSLETSQFVQARRAIEDIARRYPERPEVRKWSELVEAARSKAESQDITGYTKRVDELVSISAWDRAASVAQELLDRHPGNATGKALVERVERERQQFFAEQRRRMYAEIQRFAGRRRWREAFTAAQTFVERFPESEDAEALRVQIPTLEVNSEIEERQELESQITDLAKHARYIEAYNLAVHVVQRFPGSPQAEALRPQLPRLKELAHNPQATPARVRVDAPA